MDQIPCEEAFVNLFIRRFSPNEWVIEDHPLATGSRIQNKFSISNSFWFALSSMMQQSNDIAPRSPAGRIVSGKKLTELDCRKS